MTVSMALRGAIIWSAVLLIALIIATRPDVVRRSFDAPPGGRFVLETERGDVLVRSGAADRVEVEVHRAGLPPRLWLEFSQEGRHVGVRGRGWGALFWQPPWSERQVRFVVTVPPAYEVEISTGSGSIALAGSASGGERVLGEASDPTESL